MPQKTAPFIEGKYGWNFGEGGWNTGMDENLVKFSYLFDRNIEGVVSSLPVAVDGKAYYLSTDKRVYFAVGGVYYSSPLPNRFELFNKSTGTFFYFDTSTNTLTEDTTQSTNNTRLTNLENDVSDIQDELLVLENYAVDSIAALRLYTGNNKYVDVLGYYSPGDQGDGRFRTDLSDTTSADNGSTVIVSTNGIRRKRIMSSTIKPQIFGARGNGITDDRSALNKAIAYIRSVGGGVLDLGTGGQTYPVSGPIKLYSNMRITGRGYIVALPSFISDVVFPTYGTEVPQTYNTLLYFNDGTHADDPTNFGYRGLEIDSGVEIYGNYNCDNGLILEGITNYTISGRFQRFNSTGVYAKYYCWGGRINANISSCASVLLKLGEAANGIDLNGLQLFGDANNPTYALQIVGDNNGINLSGAFVEKMVNGILWTGLSGPATISGVDFEDCFGDLITIDGTGVIGRAAGPVTITGSFLEATNVAVKCINAVAIITGCRIRDTPLAFQTTGSSSRIYEVGNQLEGSVTRASGNVISEINGTSTRSTINRLPTTSSTAVQSYSLENNSYSFNTNLAVNLLSFSSQLLDAPTQRMTSSSTWETRELRSGSVFGVMGLKLNYSAGSKVIEPRGDNDHSLGSASLRFSTVYAGTGTINTSDERLKDQIQNIDERCLRAWSKVKYSQYKFKDAVEAKKDGARWHFGLIAQRVKEAFESEGLDAFEYGLLCHDSWSEKEAVYKNFDLGDVFFKGEEDSEPVYSMVENPGDMLSEAMVWIYKETKKELVSEAKSAGDRYGIRYEEALALECAYLRSLIENI